jgi:hypothetical protein
MLWITLLAFAIAFPEKEIEEELAAAEAYVKAQLAGKDFAPPPTVPPLTPPGRPAPALNKSTSSN